MLGLLPGPARGRPESDVGDPRRARDRDLDRVQRAALLALPPGARRRAPARRGRSSWPTPPRAPPCSPRARPRSPASRALIASDIRMLRDFGIVTVVDLTRLPDRGHARAARRASVGGGARPVQRARPRPAAAAARAAGATAARPRGRAVSRDRFDDLGGDGRHSVGERLAERDRTHPEPGGRPEVPRPGNKYAWAVGILMVMVLGVLLFAADDPQQRRGSVRPRSAASACRTSRSRSRRAISRATPTSASASPAPRARARARPARSTTANVLNSCDLTRRPAVLTFVFDRGADCFPQVDRTERVTGQRPGVSFATVYFTRKEREEVRGLVRARRLDPAGGRRPGRAGGQPLRRRRLSRPRCSCARADGSPATRLGNLTEEQLRRGAERLTRLMELELDLRDGWVEPRARRRVPRARPDSRADRRAALPQPPRGEAAACAPWPTATPAAR